MTEKRTVSKVGKMWRARFMLDGVRVYDRSSFLSRVAARRWRAKTMETVRQVLRKS